MKSGFLISISITHILACVFALTPFRPVFAHDGAVIGISTCTDLQNMQNDLAGKYELTNDIDCKGIDVAPIGSTSTPFVGEFDGKNHKIINLDFGPSHGWAAIGLFGATYQLAKIQNITLENVKIDASYNGPNNGALVGIANGSTVISNVKIIKGNIQGQQYVGGLVGYLKGGEIVNSSVEDVTIMFTGSYVGGLVGYSAGSIDNCHAKIILQTEDVRFGSNVGGLVGSLHVFGIVHNSYAEGQINSGGTIGGLVGENRGSIHNSHTNINIEAQVASGSQPYVGGLVGTTFGDITNSYSKGNIAGQSHLAGGLVGGSYSSSTILNSYSKTNVSIASFSAGLVNYCNECNIINSYAMGRVAGAYDRAGLIKTAYYPTVISTYWDIESTGQSTSAGGEGKSTAEMLQINTYQGWDFIDVWEISEGVGYPTLRMNPEMKKE